MSSLIRLAEIYGVFKDGVYASRVIDHCQMIYPIILVRVLVTKRAILDKFLFANLVWLSTQDCGSIPSETEPMRIRILVHPGILQIKEISEKA